MRSARGRTWIVVGVLALVASLGLAWVEEALVHTDDGCEVEVHCLACRLALGGVIVAPARPALGPSLASAGEVAPAPLPPSSSPAPRPALSRGPPSSRSATS